MKKLRKKVRYEKTALLLILAVVLMAIAFYYLFSTYVQPSIITVPELSTVGYTEVLIGINITDDRGVVYLDGDCYELSMTISMDQAISIEDGINRVIRARPNTHDLMKDMLKNLDAKVLMIKITELKDGTYYAVLVLRKDNLILSLDSRPSDSLAIAARTEYEVPVYVKNDLLRTGTKIC